MTSQLSDFLILDRPPANQNEDRIVINSITFMGNIFNAIRKILSFIVYARNTFLYNCPCFFRAVEERAINEYLVDFLVFYF